MAILMLDGFEQRSTPIDWGKILDADTPQAPNMMAALIADMTECGASGVNMILPEGAFTIRRIGDRKWEVEVHERPEG